MEQDPDLPSLNDPQPPTAAMGGSAYGDEAEAEGTGSVDEGIVQDQDKEDDDKDKENATPRSSSTNNWFENLEFMLLPPPILFNPTDEFCWLDLTNPAFHKLTIDKGIGLEPEEKETEAKQLFNTALHETLTISQRQTLQNELHSDPKFVHSLGLRPGGLPELVENNPLIAVDVLLKLNETSEITDFLSVLVNMEMSVHSMEVVNRLTSAVQLPKEFLHLYVSNCISTCEGYQDKYMQNRLVRLVCAFLQSVIRNCVIDIEELYIEIMTFCLEFSQIREATALYRHLKQIEADDSGLQQFVTKKLESQPNNSLQMAEAAFASKNQQQSSSSSHDKDLFK